MCVNSENRHWHWHGRVSDRKMRDKKINRNPIFLSVLAGCEGKCWSVAAERHKDRKIEDRNMKRHQIFLSAFVVRLRLCRAGFLALSGLDTTVSRTSIMRSVWAQMSESMP